MDRITKNRVVRALSPTWRSARVLIAVAMAGVLTAACDVHGVSEPGALVSISVSPNATLVAGSTQQMVAVGYDADSQVVNIAPTWSVAASGGTIASSGLFTAGTVPGLFANTVVASVGSISGRASITVIPGPLATITVVPTPVTLGVLGTQQFTAVGKDASGNIVTLTPTWSVVALGGAITQAGIFTAGGTAGTFTNTVQASSGTIKGFATVIVTPGPLTSIVVTPNPATLPVGQSQQFTAIGKDASGNVLSFAPVWTVVAGGGTINSTGLFVAGGTLGTFANTVKATSGSVSGTATVTVTLGALATITVTPNPHTMAIGGTQQMIAVGKDAGGNIVAITPVWSVVNSGGVIDPSTGIFTAGLVAGTFNNTVVATSGTISGTATITVTPVLLTITVTPNPASVIVNGTQQFAAVGRDAGGNVFAISPVWSVVNGGGSIDANTGIFTAGAVVGPFANTVKATSGTISGTATVNVTPALATIVVSPNPVSVVVNGTQQFSAVGRDLAGNNFPLSPVWSVDPVVGGGSINATTGVFTAGAVVGLFANTVRATSGAISGTATVNVTALPPVLATITITPDPASMLVNATQQFAAVGRDGSGNIISITPVWTVNPLVGGGTIDANTGLFTAGAVVGAFPNTVIATSGGIVDFATVNVTAAVVPFVFVDLGTATPLGILAATEVTCINNGTINADVSIWPGNTITGFPPPGGGTCQISGTRILGVAPADQQQIDMNTAYNTLMGLPCPAANVIADVGGTTKLAVAPVNVYCTAGAVLGITGDLTLDGNGNPNAVFVFQSLASSMTTAGRVLLQNGAKAKNVYWAIGTSATLGVSSQIQGNILANASITLVDGSTLLGRALAHTGAVTLGANNLIILP